MCVDNKSRDIGYLANVLQRSTSDVTRQIRRTVSFVLVVVQIHEKKDNIDAIIQKVKSKL